MSNSSYSYSPTPPYSQTFCYSPVVPSYSGDEEPYSPGAEEEDNSFFGVLQPGHGGQKDKKVKNLEEGKRKENLDQRLNRLMLADDLPLFLQEFAAEWQEVRMKKLVKGELVLEKNNEDEEKKLALVIPGGVLKKNVKRLGKHDNLNSRNLKEVVKKMVKVVKDKLKEDIIEKIVAEQVDSFYLSHMENLVDYAQAGTLNTSDNKP